MTNAQLLITLILVQMGLLGLLWLGAAILGLARRPALHWGAMNLLAAAAMSIAALRGSDLSVWLTMFVANLLGFAAYAVNRRGVQLFCGRPAPWHGVARAVAVFAAALGPALAAGAPAWALVGITSIALATVLLMTARDVWSGLRDEFGRRAALGCAVPVLLLGTLFAVRGVLSLALPDEVARPLAQGGRVNLGVGLMVLVSVLLVNLGLGAMVVIRTVAQLRRLSDHDSLTGLLNRRGLAALHERERARMLRGEAGYAVLLIDLDHFKQVNDQHGHEVGDALLVSVGEALQRALRPVDGVARTGGEEFCVLLPGTTPAAAAAAAARLHRAVGAVAVSTGAGGLARVTCSIGVSWAEHADDSMAAVARRADQAMYRAKADGRDRVVLATALPTAQA